MTAPQEALQERDRLVGMIQAGDWLKFMDYVKGLLPDILKKGRPSRKAVQESLIGKLGFLTWRELLESPVENNGLGWNWHSWTAWRKAWSITQEHPWLCDTGMGSSEINILAQQVQNTGVYFPSNQQELDELRSQNEVSRKEETKELRRILNSVVKFQDEMIERAKKQDKIYNFIMEYQDANLKNLKLQIEALKAEKKLLETEKKLLEIRIEKMESELSKNKKIRKI